MKKGSAIGLVVGVTFMSIIVGIAAIPDEVLLESTPLDKSKSPVIAAAKLPEITVPEAPVPQEITVPEAPMIEEPEPQVAEPEPQEVAEPETPKAAEPETYSEESEGNVFRVVVSDGIGSNDK